MDVKLEEDNKSSSMEEEEAKLGSVKHGNNSPEMPPQGRRLDDVMDLLLESKQPASKIAALEEKCRFLENNKDAIGIEIGSLKNSFEEAKKETKQQHENMVSELKKENLSMKCSFENETGDLNFQMNELKKKIGRIEQAKTEMERSFEQKVKKMNDSLETVKLSYMNREATIAEMKKTTMSLMHSLQSREAIIEEMKREMTIIQASLGEVQRSKKGNGWNWMFLASSMFVAVCFACATIK